MSRSGNQHVSRGVPRERAAVPDNAARLYEPAARVVGCAVPAQIGTANIPRSDSRDSIVAAIYDTEVYGREQVLGAKVRADGHDGLANIPRSDSRDSIVAAIYDTEVYGREQVLGAKVRADGHDGLWYDSVRSPSGTCYATFRPAAVKNVADTVRES